MIAGKLEVTVDGQTRILGPADAYLLKAIARIASATWDAIPAG